MIDCSGTLSHRVSSNRSCVNGISCFFFGICGSSVNMHFLPFFHYIQDFIGESQCTACCPLWESIRRRSCGSVQVSCIDNIFGRSFSSSVFFMFCAGGSVGKWPGNPRFYPRFWKVKSQVFIHGTFKNTLKIPGFFCTWENLVLPPTITGWRCFVIKFWLITTECRHRLFFSLGIYCFFSKVLDLDLLELFLECYWKLILTKLLNSWKFLYFEFLKPSLDSCRNELRQF